MHKKILVVVFLIVSFLLPVTASACSCDKSNTIEKYNDASMVFIGHIRAAEEVLNTEKSKNYTRRYEERYIRATYNVSEVYKGSPADGGFITSRVYAGGNCSIGLLPGHDYIIFLYSSNDVSICGGTTHYRKEENGMVMRTLQRLKNQNRLTRHSSRTPNGAP